ncbi:bromodomain-containing protein 7 [Gastrophryne carolinensis]
MYVSMVSGGEAKQQQKELSVRRRDVISGIRKKILKGAAGEMGKKHKKHKGDKQHGHEGKEEARGPPESRKGGKAGKSKVEDKDKKYVEKPLKLVLKVGTGEVKELSTARAAALPASFHDDKSDHDKHKDKKKKKKKKNEKEAGASEEKKKKKDDKKKKDKSHHESDLDNEHSSHRLDLSALSIPSSVTKPEEDQTPLQEALNQLVRQLQRKDPSSFFAFPVTDFIAPGYSVIIKHPMDFSTMKEKIKNNEYESIEELKENFKQICHNAIIYNKPGTIYYKAAKKLLNSGMKILSQERIQSLKQSIEFMADLQSGGKEKDNQDSRINIENLVEQKEESMDTSDFTAFKSPAKDFKRKDKDQLEDKQKTNEGVSEKDQEQIDQIIKDSLGKLTKRPINSQLEFERRKHDGTTTLAFLNPSEELLAGQGAAILGSTAGRLQTGVNCLQGFKEDKRNKVSPVLYLNYGPFTSYAPSYDSTFANIGKDDSDLLYTTYGEDPSLQGTFSIQEFLDDVQTQPYGMVDCILDVFSDGEYSRTERVQNKATANENSRGSDCLNTTDQLASLKSVLGLDFEETFSSDEAKKFQRKLDETTRLLCELQDVQNERLSAKPPLNTICLLAPTTKEVQIADKVNENLKDLAQQVHPGDVVSMLGLRKAMGILSPYIETEDMVVDLTAGAPESQGLPNGNEHLQVVT